MNVFSLKIIFSTNSQKFSSLKVSAIWYAVWVLIRFAKCTHIVGCNCNFENNFLLRTVWKVVNHHKISLCTDLADEEKITDYSKFSMYHIKGKEKRTSKYVVSILYIMYMVE